MKMECPYCGSKNIVFVVPTSAEYRLETSKHGAKLGDVILDKIGINTINECCEPPCGLEIRCRNCLHSFYAKANDENPDYYEIGKEI